MKKQEVVKRVKMKNKINAHAEQIIVVLKRVKLTDNLFLEKFALLDRGHRLSKNGVLPKNHFCMYWRTGMYCNNFGPQYITDWTGSDLKFSEIYNLEEEEKK